MSIAHCRSSPPTEAARDVSQAQTTGSSGAARWLLLLALLVALLAFGDGREHS